MKKILIVTTSNKMAGAEKTIFDLLRLSDKSKFEFRLVILKGKEDGELFDKVHGLGIKVESLNINSKMSFWKLYKLWRIINSFKPDILESFLFFDNQVCRIFGKLARIKHIISGQQNAEVKMNRLRIFIDKMTVNFATTIISNSVAGKDFYRKNNYKFKKEIYVIKNCIDIKALEKMQASYTDRENGKVFDVFCPKDIFRILTVGFLTKQKGIIFLIKALEILKSKGLIFQCFIIGQGVLKKELEDEVKKRNLEKQIHLVGYIPESFKYLKYFDLYVLSSLWEGLPNVVLEAMASKLPVLATSVGGVPEIIKDGETGFLVKPGSAELLSERIEFFMSLEDKKKKDIAESAYKFIEDFFDINPFIKKYENFYDKCN